MSGRRWRSSSQCDGLGHVDLALFLCYKDDIATCFLSHSLLRVYAVLQSINHSFFSLSIIFHIYASY